MFELILFCLLLGAVAGLAAGLFGIGGGLIIVPVLVWLFEYQAINSALIMIMAVATSLATIIITAVASISAHHRQGTIHWPTVGRLVPGIIVGAVAGAVIADYLTAHTLRLIFIVYLLYTAIKMATPIKFKSTGLNLTPILLSISGIIIGLISAFLGIGGGTLTVPLLVSGQMPMRNAVGTSSACGLPIAIAASISYALLGEQAIDLPEWSLGYIYLPAFLAIISTSIIFAPIGAKLANRLATAILKRYFALMLLFAAAKLLL